MAEKVGSNRTRVEHDTAMHDGNIVKTKLKRGDDAEVTSAAANGPEQIFILRFARDHVTALRVDHIGGDDVVATEAVLTHKPADAAAKREAADPGGRDDA